MSSKKKINSKTLAAISKRMKSKRLELGLSQHDLGLKAGVHISYIGMIERLEKNPTILVLEKICKSLNIKLEDLLRGL